MKVVKPVFIFDRKTKVPCWFKVFGCDGYLEVVTDKRIDDKQAICSRCGVLYLGDAKRAATSEPTISLKINWLNHHREIIDRAKERRWKQRLARLILRRRKRSV